MRSTETTHTHIHSRFASILPRRLITFENNLLHVEKKHHTAWEYAVFKAIDKWTLQTERVETHRLEQTAGGGAGKVYTQAHRRCRAPSLCKRHNTWAFPVRRGWFVLRGVVVLRSNIQRAVCVQVTIWWWNWVASRLLPCPVCHKP